MNWNRHTKHLRFTIKGERYTLERYVEVYAECVPKVHINGKPMDHRQGLLNVVLQSRNLAQVAVGFENYTRGIIRLIERLDKDKVAFETRKIERLVPEGAEEVKVGFVTTTPESGEVEVSGEEVSE